MVRESARPLLRSLWSSSASPLAGFLTTAPVASALGWGFYAVQADETTFAWAGARLLQGALPYRDHITHLPPLSLATVAAWFGLFGTSLAALRTLQVFLGALLGALLCTALRQRGLKPWAAMLGALPFGFLAFGVWPVPSHHYLACVFALAALAVAGHPEREAGSRRALAAGFLGGLSGLSLQTEGALVLVWLLLRPWKGGIFRGRILLGVGAAVPVAAAFGALAAAGGFAGSVRCLIMLPLVHYRQPGGFNDADPLDACRTWVADRLAGSMGPWETLFLAGAILVFLAIPLALLSLSGRVVTDRDRGALLALLRGLVLAAVAFSGRADAAHLALFWPFAQMALAEGTGGPERKPVRLRATLAWMVLLAILGSSAWGFRWARVRPLLPDFRSADLWLTRVGPASEASNLPDHADRPTLLYFPYGSMVYLAYAPDPPPADWLFPSDRRAQAPWEYAGMARWIRAHRPPYILLGWRFERSFLEDASPLAEVFSKEYRIVGPRKWGMLLERRGRGGDKPEFEPPGDD